MAWYVWDNRTEKKNCILPRGKHTSSLQQVSLQAQSFLAAVKGQPQGGRAQCRGSLPAASNAGLVIYQSRKDRHNFKKHSSLHVKWAQSKQTNAFWNQRLMNDDDQISGFPLNFHFHLELKPGSPCSFSWLMWCRDVSCYHLPLWWISRLKQIKRGQTFHSQFQKLSAHHVEGGMVAGRVTSMAAEACSLTCSRPDGSEIGELREHKKQV